MSTFEAAGVPEQAWKVGALAKAAGLTVRALHYYDQIGLLTPSRRSAADHRLYDGGDVARLYRISLLRRLGFPLEQIAAVLEDPQWQLADAIAGIWANPAPGRHRHPALHSAGRHGRRTGSAGQPVTRAAVFHPGGDDHARRHHPQHHRHAGL